VINVTGGYIMRLLFNEYWVRFIFVVVLLPTLRIKLFACSNFMAGFWIVSCKNDFTFVCNISSLTVSKTVFILFILLLHFRHPNSIYSLLQRNLSQISPCRVVLVQMKPPMFKLLPDAIWENKCCSICQHILLLNNSRH